MSYFLLIVTLFVTANLWAEGPAPGTLAACYQAARRHSEVLARQREDILQSGERARGAQGGLFPDVSWNWKRTRQDAAGLPPGGFGGFLEKDQTESKFTVAQPVFSGLREFSARAGFQREQARDHLRLARAERELYGEVAEAFYRVIDRETALANTRTTLALAQDRVKELRDNLRLGKSRESEVFSAESRVAALRADAVRQDGQIRLAREDLAFLTGEDLPDAPLVDALPDAPPVPPVTDFLARARNRSDVEAQRRDVEGRRFRVRYEKGAHWPDVNLTGNRYTRRPSFFEPVDWDLMLELRAPLFQGGAVQAQVREAASQLRQSRQDLQRLERRARTDIRKAYAAWTAALEEARALEDAHRAARHSYEAQRREYRLGLVTNLEVLQALTDMQAERSAWDAARLEAKRQYIALAIAAEVLP